MELCRRMDIDFEDATSHDIAVEVTDAGGNTYSETITLNVSDLNEGPTDIIVADGEGQPCEVKAQDGGTLVRACAAAGRTEAQVPGAGPGQVSL